MCGINDDRIQQTLLSEKGFTYKKALGLLQGLEMATKNIPELQSMKLEQPAQVHKVTPGQRGRIADGWHDSRLLQMWEHSSFSLPLPF